MRISDWSSDVCSSDLNWLEVQRLFADDLAGRRGACSNSIFALLLAIGFDLLGQLRNRYVIAGNGRQLLRYPLRGACVNVVAYLEHGESGFDANDAIASLDIEAAVRRHFGRRHPLAHTFRHVFPGETGRAS